MLVWLKGYLILGALLILSVSAQLPSYPVNSCSTANACFADYQCFSCKYGDFKARCFLKSNVFDSMVCCGSWKNHETTCDTSYNAKCCDSLHLSNGTIAGIIVGCVILTLGLALLAWYVVRRYRRSQDGYEDIEPTPTAYAEQIAAYEKRGNPYAAQAPKPGVITPAYGSYQSF